MKSETIKPKQLQQGGTIGILAVSGRIKDFQRIEYASEYFKKLGYKTVISSTCRTSHRYSAGISDEDCIEEFHKFFSDKSIDAVICARGGFGALKLIDKIDWNIVKNNPKIFAGYSDITILLAMIYKKTGLITFHAPMASGDFGAENEIENYTADSFFSTLKGCASIIKADNLKVYNKGAASGILWGGNLASLASMCGRDFAPDEDIVLFLEDVNEPVYKIDRMLAQIFSAGNIKNNVKGIAIGAFTNSDDNSMLDEVISEYASCLNLPAAGGFKISHGKIKDTVPYCVQACFNASLGTISFGKYTC